MGGRAKNVDMGDSLEAFNDILTCLAGVLILIVILVVLDSKQAKIFIPTPITHSADSKLPMWVEVNSRGELHPIPVQELYEWASDTVSGVRAEHGELALAKLASVPATNGAYVVNLYQTVVGIGTLEIQSIRDLKGHDVEFVDVDAKDTSTLKRRDWFGGVLGDFDKERNYMAFIVRSSDDAFVSFKAARARAWLENISVAYALVGNNEPLHFSEAGKQLGLQ